MARERAEEYVGRLREVYGSDLVAAALYGSAARGDYREGVSDLNLLVVLRGVDAARLRRGSALAREWVAQGNPPPLLLSEAEWRGSADVFSIEYADIRDAHLVLHGDDLFADLTIDWLDLRLQTERELRESEIRLRERYLLVAESPEELGRLLKQSFPTFLTLFRAGLRLLGTPIPRDPLAVVREMAQRAGFDPQPWEEVVRARMEQQELAPQPDAPVVTGYLDGVHRTSRWLDTLAVEGPPGRI